MFFSKLHRNNDISQVRLMHIVSIGILVFFLLWSCFSMTLAQIGNCEAGTATAFLETGNVEAQIYNNGPLFWKGGQSKYEVPKGSGIQALFASNVVVGGLINGQLRMAASTYHSYEFWPGPLDEDGHPPSDCTQYDQIWEINDDDFILFEQEGTFSDNMLNWPWHLGAPVIDGDGIADNYNLEAGDRPELLGDQTLWWVMNDLGNEHLWSELNPIGLEVKASAFGFNQAQEIGEITFYRYHITNKNTSSLTQAFLGMWSDPDLGNASDDFFGSDSLLHMGYTYNDSFDDSYYEATPPAIGYTFLITPDAEVDSLDNDHDGQIDEQGERAGMYSAISYAGGGGILGDPGNGTELYHNLRGRWQNGQLITLGGYGIDYSTTPSRFMFSGDPVTGSFWSQLRPTQESSAALSAADKRFVISSGPFTILPDESVEFLVAIVWARGINHLDSVQKLKGIVSTLQSTPDAYLFSGFRNGQLDSQAPHENVLGFDQNFPNPFSSTTTLRYSLPKAMQVRLVVYDLLGREVATLVEGLQEAGVYSVTFDGSPHPPGMYLARIQLDHLQFTKKLVKALNE